MEIVRFKKCFILSLAITLVLFFVAGAFAKPKYGGILRVIVSEDPEGSIGVPENMRGAGSRYIKGSVLEPLVVQLFDGSMQPWLAKSFKWSRDGRTFTMYLRKGVKFHDGTDFNAEAVKWNWDRVTAAGAAGTKEVESLEIIDDYTVAFHFKEFRNTWIDNITSCAQAQTSLMISPTAYKKNGKEWANWHPVGTGCFKFKSYTQGQSMVQERFDDYWGEKPFLDGLTYIFIKDFVTAEIAFEAGEGDAILPSGGHDRDLLNDLMPKGKGYWAMMGPGLTTVIVPPGARSNSPFSKLKVRQAVEHAIDKEKVVKSIYFGYAKPKAIPVYEWQLAYDKSIKGREYNPKKARQLLAEAGYPNGFKTTLYCQFFTCGNDASAIQAYLKDIGIDSNIETLSIGKWIDMETNGWEDGLLLTFVGPESSRAQVERDWMTPTGPNWGMGIWYNTLYRPKELQKLTQDYFKLSSIRKEKAQGRKIIKVIYDNAIVIPLWEHQGTTLFQPYVKNTSPDLWALSMFFEWRRIHTFWLDK